MKNKKLKYLLHKKTYTKASITVFSSATLDEITGEFLACYSKLVTCIGIPVHANQNMMIPIFP